MQEGITTQKSADSAVRTEQKSELPPYLHVLPTKLQPPRLRGDTVLRRDLIDLLQADPDQQVVVIEAPAGYGKSTLVAQWLAKTGTPTGWVSLDASDNEPNRFFGIIVAALRMVDQEIGKRALAKLAGVTESPDQSIIEALIEDLASITRPCALVFDDFQTITEQGLLQSFGVLLRNLPASMQVFILSRSALSLPLSRFRASGDLLEITFDDLRFSDAEARELLSRDPRIDLTTQEVLLLNQRAEGWPAGLRLAWHVMKGLPRERVQALVEEFSGQLGPIENFLWEEALHSLPEPRVEFLQKSAVFDRFCAELYDAVFDTHDAFEQLRALDAGNLFIIPLDSQGVWFRYHQLFRDVLRHRLSERAPEEEIARAHRRAASWFQEHGFDDEAIRHAVAGRDWERAIALVGPIARQLYQMDYIAPLRTRLEMLPQSVLDDHPELSFLLAWGIARSGRVGASLRPMSAAERAWRAAGDQENLGRIEALRAFQSAVASDYRDAVAHADRAFELLPAGNTVERSLTAIFKATAQVLSGLPDAAEATMAESRVARQAEHDTAVWHLEALTVGTILVERGKLPEAAVMLRRSVRPENQITHIQVQHALTHLGMLYYEQNEIEEAEQCFYRGVRLSDETGIRLWRGRFHVGLARVARAHGDFETAFAEIESALRVLEEVGSPQEEGKALAFQARLWLDANQFALVHHWLDRVDLEPFEREPRYERFFEKTTYVRLLLAEGGRDDVALDLLNVLQEGALATGRSGDLVELEMLRAIALRSLDDTAGSVAALERALELGEAGGYVRVFVDEGERVAPILRHVSVRGRYRDYARNLLSVIDDSWTLPAPSQSGLIETLSEREIQVLRLVGIGLQNRAIGDRLFITEGTVKKHLSSILGKLQVSNRTQAIDQARRMGLLHD